jgi:glycosyltransferase involved in cell wall biosynthesis
MKILLIVSSLTGGGAERVCASWANGLADCGHEVSILTDLQRGISYPVRKCVHIIQVRQALGPNRVIRRLQRLLFVTRQIHSLCEQNKYDAVIDVLFAHWLELKLGTYLIGYKLCTVMTDHNVCKLPEYLTMPISTQLKKFVWSRLFDCYTVLTKVDLAVVEQKGVSNAKVLYNPVFLLPSAESIPCKRKVVLSMGRLDVWHCKGFDLLIKAWNEVAPRHSDWSLKIVGNGRDETISMLRSLSQCPNSIEFLPYQNPKNLYEEAAIYVLPSRYEGWGLVMVEAMSQGCATVACNFGGRQAEAIEDGVNGILCETDNPNAIAQKINLLIENEDLRHRIQYTATESLAQFSEKNVAKRLESIINSTKV